MCTGFHFHKEKHHYLARTMDFAFEFNGILQLYHVIITINLT